MPGPTTEKGLHGSEVGHIIRRGQCRRSSQA